MGAAPARRSRAAVIGWSVAACFAMTTMLFATGLIFGVRAGPASEVVEMRELLLEEGGRIVSKTIEFDEHSVPHISAHFASVFGMDADALAEADGYLRVQREAYLAQESAVAVPYWDKYGERVMVRVDDFYRDRSDFVRHTMTLLAGTLGGRKIPAPAVEEIERALFPLGRGVSLLTFTDDEQAGLSLRVTSTSEDLGVFEVTGDRVLREFGHHLDGLSQPPVSVLPSARSLLNVLEEIDWSGAQWTVSELMTHQSASSVESVDPELDVDTQKRSQRRYKLHDAPPRMNAVRCMVILTPAEAGEPGAKAAGAAGAAGAKAAGAKPVISEAFLSEIQTRVMAHIESQAWCDTSQTFVSGRLISRLPQGQPPHAELVIGIGALISHAPTSFAPPGLDLTRITSGPILSEAFQEAGMQGLTETHSSLRSAPGLFRERSTTMDYEDSETVSTAAEILAVLEGIERGGQAGTVTSFVLNLDVTNLTARSSLTARTSCNADFLIRGH